jgi:hypothetical protein
MRRGLPVAVHIESATPHEVTLVHATLAQRFVKPFPVRLIGDNAYESDRRSRGSPECSNEGSEPHLVAEHNLMRPATSARVAFDVATWSQEPRRSPPLR